MLNNYLNTAASYFYTSTFSPGSYLSPAHPIPLRDFKTLPPSGFHEKCQPRVTQNTRLHTALCTRSPGGYNEFCPPLLASHPSLGFLQGAADRSKGQPQTDSRTARPVNTCHCVLDTGATMKNIWFGSWRLAAPEKQRVFLMLVLV